MDQTSVNKALEDLKVIKMLLGSNYRKNDNDGLFYFLFGFFYLINWLFYIYLSSTPPGGKGYFSDPSRLFFASLLLVIILPCALGCIFRFIDDYRNEKRYLIRVWLSHMSEALVVVVASTVLYVFLTNPSPVKAKSMLFFLFILGILFYLTGIGWNFRFRIIGFIYLVACLFIMLYPVHYQFIYPFSVTFALLLAGMTARIQYKRKMQLTASVTA